MKLYSYLFLAGGVFAGPALSCLAASEDPFAFFAEEAEVITAARRPVPRHKAPATVYVIQGEELLASGARTLWDALRSVPGVDVMTTRTFHGEVSIRGLNQAFSNRTLVLLDGKMVLNGYFDFVIWEEIPVTLDEIDRIEVVEGPISALYGANAITGVINIITKTPDQIGGGSLSYTTGERNTQLGSFLYGNQTEMIGYKIGFGWRSINRFENSSQKASEVGKFHAGLNVELGDQTFLGFSGGLANTNTQLTTGNNGTAFADGQTGFVRTDFMHKNTRLRVFWNRSRAVAREFAFFQSPQLDYDTRDIQLEQSVALPFQNSLVLGTGYRKNSARSKIFQGGLVVQDLWALFFEDEWRPWDRWTLVASGRWDHHPFTKGVFSPRGSLVYEPGPRQTLRLSAGRSFRNPTLLENYANFTQIFPNTDPDLPNPPFTSIESTLVGNRSLTPEKMRMVELAHSGRFGRLRTTTAVFHYKLKNITTISLSKVTSMNPPAIGVQNTYVKGQEITAWGAELGLRAALWTHGMAHVNYAYQEIRDPLAIRSREAPKHKVNAGLGWEINRLGLQMRMHWVSQTSWNQSQPGAPRTYAGLRDYVLLNGQLSYSFSGILDGLKLSLGGFNLADHKHFEILGSQDIQRPGQGGEIIRSHWTATIRYRF